MKVGDVIRWNNYPLRNDESSKIKPRWFICLGERKDGSCFVVMCTATTKKQYYDPIGKRCGNPIVEIKAGQFGFDCDCLLDLKLGLIHDEITPEILEKKKADIQLVSNVLQTDRNFMRMIYNNILKSGHSPRIILDIHESFNLAGITGLQKPKMRN